MAGQPDRRRGPKRDAQMRLRRPHQKRATEQQKYQPDIAQKMLIEGSGGCHARNRHVPIGGRHKHEDAVRYQCDAEQRRYTEIC